jgi:hypothetical protein
MFDVPVAIVDGYSTMAGNAGRVSVAWTCQWASPAPWTLLGIEPDVTGIQSNGAWSPMRRGSWSHELAPLRSSLHGEANPYSRRLQHG